MKAGREASLVELIRDEGEAALSFIEGMERDRFLSDSLVQHAVAMCLISIGEYAAKLLQANPGVAIEQPEIPFQEIIGMRNRIAHGYYGLDFEVVWDTVRQSIPELLRKLPTAEPRRH